MTLELLAPARNAAIGIAAIDCGADAVYIAGPGFGARQAAGNSVEEIAQLCDYAHRFGARIFITFNTILFDAELDEARTLLARLQEAGADGFIIQDLAVLTLAREAGITVPLHASTQCAIRTPEDARRYESLGCSRLVLERQLSLDEIRAIRAAVSCELECFVHGALCVCYSGHCYLSQALSGRSANRGACIQACRSRYDLVDESGRVLVRNKALLSLKDFNLLDRLPDLAAAGVCSFKIEGRLKNISYVRNVVREYSLALDALAEREGYQRASWGRVTQGFTPDPAKTFNRGYTDLYIDGKRGQWAAMDTPKSMGEAVGTVARLLPDGFTLNLRSGVRLANGDGFAFADADGIVGFRGDVCQGTTVRCKPVRGLKPGLPLYRNISADFEKVLDRQRCVRYLDVSLSLSVQPDDQHPDFYRLIAEALSEDGRRCRCESPSCETLARDPERMEGMLRAGFGKSAGHYRFTVSSLVHGDVLPLLSAAEINALRRELAAALDRQPCQARPLLNRPRPEVLAQERPGTYRDNLSNHLSAGLFPACEPAYECRPQEGAELMRTRYCVRYELGLCPRYQGSGDNRPLYLLNNGRRFTLRFDCRHCEMTVV